MSLLSSMMEHCCIMNHIREDDKFGSSIDYWKDGSRFDATIIKNNTTEAIVAEKQGVSEIYTIVTTKGMKLDYHDVIKRLSDGQTFRVTSNIKDSEAPNASSVQIAKVTAEKWLVNND